MSATPPAGAPVPLFPGEICPDALVTDMQHLQVMAREIPYCISRDYAALERIIVTNDSAAMFSYASCIVYLTGFCARLAHENAGWFSQYSTLGPFSDSVNPGEPIDFAESRGPAPSTPSKRGGGTPRKGATATKTPIRTLSTAASYMAADSAANCAAGENDASYDSNSVVLIQGPTGTLAGFVQRTIASETVRWTQHIANLWRRNVPPRAAIDIAEGSKGIATIPGLTVGKEMLDLVLRCPDLPEWLERAEAAKSVRPERWSALTLCVTLQWTIARDPPTLLRQITEEVLDDIPTGISWVAEPASRSSGSGRRKRPATPRSGAGTPRSGGSAKRTASAAVGVAGTARALLPSLDDVGADAVCAAADENTVVSLAPPAGPASNSPATEPVIDANATLSAESAQGTPTRRSVYTLPVGTPLSKEEQREAARLRSPFLLRSSRGGGEAPTASEADERIVKPSDSLAEPASTVGGAGKTPRALAMLQRSVSAAGSECGPMVAPLTVDHHSSDSGIGESSRHESSDDESEITVRNLSLATDVPLSQVPLSQQQEQQNVVPLSQEPALSLSQADIDSAATGAAAKSRARPLEWASEEEWRKLMADCLANGLPPVNPARGKQVTITPATEARVYCVTHVVLVLAEFGTRPILDCCLSDKAGLARRAEADARLEQLGRILAQWLMFLAAGFPETHAANSEIVVEIAASMMILKQNGVRFAPRVLEALRRTVDVLLLQAVTRGKDAKLRNAGPADKESVFVPGICYNQPKTAKGAAFASYHTHFLVAILFQLVIVDTFGGVGRVNYPNTDGTENYEENKVSFATIDGSTSDEESDAPTPFAGIRFAHLVEDTSFVLPTLRPFPEPRPLERGRYAPTPSDIDARLNHWSYGREAIVRDADASSFICSPKTKSKSTSRQTLLTQVAST